MRIWVHPQHPHKTKHGNECLSPTAGSEQVDPGAKGDLVSKKKKGVGGDWQRKTQCQPLAPKVHAPMSVSAHTHKGNAKYNNSYTKLFYTDIGFWGSSNMEWHARALVPEHSTACTDDRQVISLCRQKWGDPSTPSLYCHKPATGLQVRLSSGFWEH